MAHECVLDVRDPRRPQAVSYVAAPPGTWNIHLQTHENLLLVVNAKDMFAAAEFADERAYYRGQIGQTVGTAGSAGQAAKAERDWTAGLAVYDISHPAAPRQIGFMPVEGGGIHRIWYVGGRWAYVSALLDGRPTRWAEPVMDYDGRERTLEVFLADAAEQRDMLRRLRPVRSDLQRAAGGPLVIVFHTRAESGRLYADFLDDWRRSARPGLAR